jgi:hypothetical protein
MTESEKEKARRLLRLARAQGLVVRAVSRRAFWNSPLKGVSPPGQLVS